MKKTIIAGSRSSRLAKAQLEEVRQELKEAKVEVDLTPLYLDTRGDRDRQTSLRNLDKTDFFTRELDQALLLRKCRIAVHSAKDLPEPLLEGIALVALTKGKNPADSLVMQEGKSLDTLPPGSVIATSSLRREHAVRQIRPDLSFCDIRGNIHERLEKIERGEVDGVVVAEAALIRLGLTHLNRALLPGETAALQGQLAILARKKDEEIYELFSSIDTRRQCGIPLYRS